MNATILQGNCIDTLKTLPAGSVQTCVTSPPYWGLRDYGTAKWEGGDPACDHSHKRGGNGDASAKQVSSEGTQMYQYRGVCPKCGAVRVDEQIGMEETPEEFVNHLVLVFREVWRVLKDDGTLWLNLGDSYAGSGGPGSQYDNKAGKSFRGEFRKYENANKKVAGLKPKDLVGIPWMVAFALRADGWYLRSDIIWNKPNPMPESVTDRPTKSHEYIFLLSKSPKYFYDAEAVKEPAVTDNPDVNSFSRRVNESPPPGKMNQHRPDRADVAYTGTRNKRTVWTVTPKPYRGAHFATFPPDLIEPCILAGSRPGDVVLDPFNGSGTTGAVSLKHGRGYIGCELNPEYIELSHDRFSKVQYLMFGVANA
jgi:DNA modification methylase